MPPDLRDGLRLSVRERPFVTGVNGLLMAGCLSSVPRQRGFGLTSAGAVNPTALAARVVAVRLSSGWTNVPGGLLWMPRDGMEL
jgi:hypothetical protein